MFSTKQNKGILLFVAIFITLASIFGDRAGEPVTKEMIGLLFAYVTFLHMTKVE